MLTRQSELQRPMVKRARTTASLSIVVVSAGSSESRYRAVRVLMDTSANLAAQVIVVSRSEPDQALNSLLSRGVAQFVGAPAGCTRAEMCDLGMSQVTGTIVAVRDEADIGDAGWLRVFQRVVPSVTTESVLHDRAIAVGGETVILDTMMAGHGHLGDVAPILHPRGDIVRSPVASVEMAAIM